MPERGEKFQLFYDVNGKDIVPGAVGRLSEQGRSEFPLSHHTVFRNLPNLRFKIFESKLAVVPMILVKTIETENPHYVVLRPEWIVMES